jgi:hypothetical protein
MVYIGFGGWWGFVYRRERDLAPGAWVRRIRERNQITERQKEIYKRLDAEDIETPMDNKSSSGERKRERYEATTWKPKGRRGALFSPKTDNRSKA